jgi:AbrB family looped-hinge helix DNA binding protein
LFKEERGKEDSEPLVKVSKINDKGLVTIPLEIRRKLGLTPGTKMIVMATEDAVVLRKGVMLFAKEPPTGLLRKIRAMFSKVPISNIEE